MSDNRRSFIKKTASLAAATTLGGLGSLVKANEHEQSLPIREYAKDAGMQLSEAYFRGLEEKRVNFCKQLDVFGAVTGVRVAEGLKPWDPQAIKTNKELWEKAGLKWNVVEGPPSLGDKTKNERNTQHGIVTKERLWKNLEYFLKAIVPEAEKIGMKLAMHPDDPQVESIKGIERIMTSPANFERMMKMYPSTYNGVTLCQGNFSLMGDVDIPKLVRKWGKDKIHFVHFRNVQDLSGKKPSTRFTETFHDEGQIDMYTAMKAYYDIGYKGAIRPDHVPTMFGDTNERPGYSTIGTLFALGYMRGLIESIQKKANKVA